MNRIQSNIIEVSIEVDGSPLTVYQKDGRYWIAGEAGKPYSIVVRSAYGWRIEVLESVDGRNVLQDEPASFRNSGMVIRDRWANRGWRLNDRETRDFVFADPTSSIAAQATGSTVNVGVIGVAAFAEREHPVMRHTGYAVLDSFDSSAQVKSLSVNRAGGQSLSADLGTGMGDLRNDSVGRTTFERRTSEPTAIIEIQYRSREWLIDRGIISPDLPSAWPGGNTGYGKYSK